METTTTKKTSLLNAGPLIAHPGKKKGLFQALFLEKKQEPGEQYLPRTGLSDWLRRSICFSSG